VYLNVKDHVVIKLKDAPASFFYCRFSGGIFLNIPRSDKQIVRRRLPNSTERYILVGYDDNY
jgi:hypothetical protein